MDPNSIQATAEMLIRIPVARVFEAFINPEITSKFWFTRGSGILEAGKQVRWDWDMYGISIEVHVRAVEPNQRIVIEWPGYTAPTTVEWTFTPHGKDATFVRIVNTGFSGEVEVMVKDALDSVGGFTMVLAGAKAWLEHHVTLNLVADHSPAALGEH